MLRSDESTHDDDISEGCTEDALIGSRASSQSVSSTSTVKGSKCRKLLISHIKTLLWKTLSNKFSKRFNHK